MSCMSLSIMNFVFDQNIPIYTLTGPWRMHNSYPTSPALGIHLQLLPAEPCLRGFYLDVTTAGLFGIHWLLWAFNVKACYNQQWSTPQNVANKASPQTTGCEVTGFPGRLQVKTKHMLNLAILFGSCYCSKVKVSVQQLRNSLLFCDVLSKRILMPTLKRFPHTYCLMFHGFCISKLLYRSPFLHTQIPYITFLGLCESAKEWSLKVLCTFPRCRSGTILHINLEWFTAFAWKRTIQ